LNKTHSIVLQLKHMINFHVFFYFSTKRFLS